MRPRPEARTRFKINYLLNHKAPGALNTDIQQVIWQILGLPVPPEIAPTPLAAQMLADVNANGGSFVPGPGQVLGLDPHTVARGRQQLLDRNVAPGRTRRSGGGRKPAEKKPPTSSL
jgi:hypothetical protein